MAGSSTTRTSSTTTSPETCSKTVRRSFETLYKQYEGMAQPRITAVHADVDIYPQRRWVDIRGRYTLRQQDRRVDLGPALPAQPPDGIRSGRDPGSPAWRPETRNSATTSTASRSRSGPATNWRSASTSGSRTAASSTQLQHQGGLQRHLLRQFHSTSRTSATTADPSSATPTDRRKHDLPPVQRFAKLEDRVGPRRHRTSATRRTGSDFETVVSTSVGQTALAPRLPAEGVD